MLHKGTIVLFSAICFCLLACSFQNEDVEFNVEEVMPFSVPNECNEGIFPTPFYLRSRDNYIREKDSCKVIIRDSIHRLNSSLTSLFPNFCMNAPERIYFQNLNGEYQAFEVSLKTWAIIRDFWNEDCINGCAYRDLFEIAQLSLKSVTKSTFVRIIFSTERYSVTNTLGTHLRILDEVNRTEPDYYLDVFLTPDDALGAAKFHEEFEINDISYNKVIESPEITSSPVLRRILYNTEYGFIGFVDDELITWNLII